MLRLDSAPPILRARRGRLARRARARGGRREPLRGVRGDAGRARRRRRDPPRRARALPLLRGAGAALRRARIARSRSTTSAARPASRSAAKNSSTCSTSSRRRRRGSRRTSRRRSRSYARRAPRCVHRRLLLRRPQLVARGRRRVTGSRERSASTAGPARDATGRRARSSARGEVAAPILGLWAAPTRGSRWRTSRRSSAALDEAGVEHEIVIYPGAPHSFFDRKQEEFAEASRTPGAARSRSSSAIPRSALRLASPRADRRRRQQRNVAQARCHVPILGLRRCLTRAWPSRPTRHPATSPPTPQPPGSPAAQPTAIEVDVGKLCVPLECRPVLDAHPLSISRSHAARSSSVGGGALTG